MGFDPVSLAVMGVAGAGISGFGAYEKGQSEQQQFDAQAANADYQSQVAANNALIANQNVAMTEQAGVAKEAAQGMKTAASVGTIKAAQGASGIDVNTGSAAQVREAAAELGAQDALTIRSNTAREAYGYEVASTSDTASSKLLTSEAGQAREAGDNAAEAGDISALGTFLSGASSVGSKYSGLQLGRST